MSNATSLGDWGTEGWFSFSRDQLPLGSPYRLKGESYGHDLRTLEADAKAGVKEAQELLAQFMAYRLKR